MKITREVVAEKIGAYRRHQLTLAEVVDWAEVSMQECEIDDSGFEAIRDALARSGLSDVRAFGLTWEDFESLLHRLGYSARVQIHAME